MSMLNAVIISDMSIIIFIIKHPHHSGRNVMLVLCLIVLMGEPGRLCVGDRAGLPGLCVFFGNTSVVLTWAGTFVTSTTFVTAHQFCQFISAAFVNLTTFVNSELTSYVNNINHLCRYRRGHYFCQQGPTTFVNRNLFPIYECYAQSQFEVIS